MNKLKYDFIDDNHKRMHNVLIAAGCSCENDVNPECSENYWNWVYCKKNEYIYFDNIEKIIYHRNKLGVSLNLHYKSFSEVADIIEAELNNIRDTNPDDQPVQSNEVVDQPVEMHEEVEESGLTWKQGIENTTGWKQEVYQKQFPQVTVEEINEEHYPITKDNIVEVLEYNDICLHGFEIKNDWVLMSIQNSDHMDKFCFKNPKWLELIELNLGIKLKPIPKPNFDFVQYLLDNGWTSNNYNSECISSKRKTMMIVIKDYKFHHYDNSKQLYDCSEYNAKILVEMSNLGEKLS